MRVGSDVSFSSACDYHFTRPFARLYKQKYPTRIKDPNLGVLSDLHCLAPDFGALLHFVVET